MTFEEMQVRVNTLQKAMLGKGLAQPDAQFSVKANVQPHVYLHWKAVDRNEHDFHFARGRTPAECFDAADEWIAALPDAENRRRDEFLKLIAKAADYGKANGIDEALVNPLVETAQRISVNALTDQSGRAA